MTRPPTGSDASDGPPTYTQAIYGSLLVTSLVAVQWRGTPSPDGIALSLVVGIVVFWLAHIWAEVVNLRVRNQFRMGDAVVIARDEAALLAAVVLPALVLALGPRLGLTVDEAIGGALIVCIGQLFVWGLVVGRAAHRGWLLPLVVAVVDSLLGVVIVALKVAVLH
ncbi:MAG TPA: hypothetical protein VFO05_07920 [Candidatus Limnocylindrales bacterium]|nr:hypothetical protein [Candidatus Limnocylindrales bacterium]